MKHVGYVFVFLAHRSTLRAVRLSTEQIAEICRLLNQYRKTKKTEIGLVVEIKITP